jgi:hypothetical protein
VTAPLVVGTVLALGALAVVLYPLFYPSDEPLETGSPAVGARSDDLVEAALRTFRASHPDCPRCGPRPESDATFCSDCGRPLAPPDQRAP